MSLGRQAYAPRPAYGGFSGDGCPGSAVPAVQPQPSPSLNRGGPGQQQQQQQQQQQALVKVIIHGLANTLCTGFMFEAMLEQAGLERGVLACEMWNGEPCGGAVVSFTNQQDANRCKRHFDGCLWSGMRVQATMEFLTPPRGSLSPESPSAAPAQQVADSPSQSPMAPGVWWQNKKDDMVAPKSKAGSEDGSAGTKESTNSGGFDDEHDAVNAPSATPEDGVEDDLWEIRTQDSFEDYEVRTSDVFSDFGGRGSKTPPSEVSTAFVSPALSCKTPPSEQSPAFGSSLSPMPFGSNPFCELMPDDDKAVRRHLFTPPASPAHLYSPMASPYPNGMQFWQPQLA